MEHYGGILTNDERIELDDLRQRQRRTLATIPTPAADAAKAEVSQAAEAGFLPAPDELRELTYRRLIVPVVEKYERQFGQRFNANLHGLILTHLHDAAEAAGARFDGTLRATVEDAQEAVFVDVPSEIAAATHEFAHRLAFADAISADRT